eukprot:TsM_000334200 transcript=TsM_000334200 gene=TsM_000334200
MNCQMLEHKETGKNPPPPNFYVSKVGSFFFQLSWNTRSLAESHPLYINIIAITNRPESKHKQQANFSRGKHDFVGLDSDTLYTVKAEVFGSAGSVFVYNTSIRTLPFGDKEKILTTGGSALSFAISMVVFACMAVFFA